MDRILKASKAKLMVITFSLLAFSSGLAGCASGSSRGEKSEYDENLFYMQQAAPPQHPGRANSEFFNKVCEPTGNQGSWQGREFECRYTD
jgi:hypothetical protein